MPLLVHSEPDTVVRTNSFFKISTDVLVVNYGPKVRWTRQPACNGWLFLKALRVVSYWLENTKFLMATGGAGKENELGLLMLTVAVQ